MKYEDVKNQMEFDKFEEMAYAKHDKLIDTFLQDIDKLSKKTRNNHKWNLDCFLNFHLVRRMGMDFEDADDDSIYEFFSYTLKYKVLGLSKADVKSYGATLRKFYQSMAEHGLYPVERLVETLIKIKDDTDELAESVDEDFEEFW